MAFDINAYTFLPWIREHGIDEAKRAIVQLDSLISQVLQQKGKTASDTDFCDMWESGDTCAEYLRSWKAELERACFFLTHGVPTPEERLQAAKTIGGSTWYLEVRRLTREAGMRESKEAANIFALIAPLDVNDPTIDRDVHWARKRLKEIIIPRDEST
jgi:hypothetical protein